VVPVLTTKPFGETTERADLRAMVEALLSRHLPPERARALDREGAFARDVWRALGEAGLLGLGGPEEAGGSGGTVGDAAAVVEEIARVLPGLAVDYVLGGMTVRLLTEADAGAARRLLPDLAAGRRIGSFGLSEPDGGTDLLALRTTAREDGDEWVLDGRKLWISLATEADTIFTLARTDPVDPAHRSRGLSIIAVPTDQPGVTVRRVHLAGMRPAMTSEVFLDGARAPLGDLVGTRGRAMAALGATLDIERVLAAGISLGIARAALDLHVAYLGQREAFGRTLGSLQVLQHAAADSITELTAARALVAAAVAAIEAGAPARDLSGMAKLNAAETTARVVDRGMRALGAFGLAEEGPMQMFFRDARLQLFSPVSNEMVRNVLGESLGLDRSY
jgi:alkylation response protein AidB-like acyl-CoA dehydrogenase